MGFFMPSGAGASPGVYKKLEEYSFNNDANYIIDSSYFEANKPLILVLKNVVPSVDLVNAYLQVSNDANSTFESGPDYDGGGRLMYDGSETGAALQNMTYAPLHDSTADNYRLTTTAGSRWNSITRIDNHWDANAYTLFKTQAWMVNRSSQSLLQLITMSYDVADVVNGAQLAISSGAFASGILEILQEKSNL